MAHGPANIQSPDIIKMFRADFIKFTEECRRTIEDIQRDVSKTQHWIEREQLPYWKREINRRHEIVQRCKSEYAQARAESGPMGRNSGIDQKKALDKAIRMLEEAEQKTRTCKSWLMNIEQKAAKTLGPVTALSSLVYGLGPKAVNSLDSMLDKLDDYLRPSTGAASE